MPDPSTVTGEENVRPARFWRYVLRVGLLYWGVPATLLELVDLRLTHGNFYLLASLGRAAVMLLPCGILFGALMWVYEYRRRRPPT